MLQRLFLAAVQPAVDDLDLLDYATIDTREFCGVLLVDNQPTFKHTVVPTDLPVVAVTFATAAVTALVFGLVPAWFQRREHQGRGLRESVGRGGGGVDRARAVRARGPRQRVRWAFE